MKTYKNLPAIVRTLIDHHCDICKQTIPIPVPGSDEVRSVTIFGHRGEYLDGEDWTERFDSDVCLQCFEEKIIPALRAMGCTVDWR